MVSALNQKKMVLRALEKGAKHFIIKPFEVERFKEVVEKVLWEM
jgi:two-component system chemotaxis response regulator CheY